MPRIKPLHWRMKKPCTGCPFTHKACQPRPARWREIKTALLKDAVFWCHETTVQDELNEDEMRATGKSLVCAGSLTFQHRHNVASQYEQVAERLNAARMARADATQTKGKRQQ